MSDLDPLKPRPDEVARVASVLDAEGLVGVRDALRPTSSEVLRLRSRVRPARTRVWAPAVAAGLALAALLLLTLRGLPTTSPMQVEATLSAAEMAIGPSIRTWGDARIVTRPHQEGAIVTMERGTAWFEVDPDGEARSLEVRAGDVQVAVTGTRFVVVYEDAVTVRVERGSVRVTHPGGQASVRAGATWTNAVAVAEVEPTPSPAPDAPVHETLDWKATATTAPETARPTARKAAASAPVEAPSASAPGEVPTSDETASFAAILDQADRGDPEVIAAIEAFLSAWPGSPLAAEAELLRLEALARTSPASAERAASAWLSANPRGARRGDVLWLHATVARDGLQDCALALPSYRELADVGPRRADASALQGLCAGALGRPAESRAALERAVDLEVGGALAKRVADALADF